MHSHLSLTPALEPRHEDVCTTDRQQQQEESEVASRSKQRKWRETSGGFIVRTAPRASSLSSHFLENHRRVLEPLFVPIGGLCQEGRWQKAPAECKGSQQKVHSSWGCRQHPDDFLAPTVRLEASSSSCSALHFVFWNICPWLMAAMWAITAISPAHRKENLWICHWEDIHPNMGLPVRDTHAFALIHFYLFRHICCLSPCSREYPH